jgi:hypothetical protein
VLLNDQFIPEEAEKLTDLVVSKMLKENPALFSIDST